MMITMDYTMYWMIANMGKSIGINPILPMIMIPMAAKILRKIMMTTMTVSQMI